MRSQQWALRGTNGIESLVLEEVEVAEPGDYEIQIKLHAASLNFRDIKVATASHPSTRLRLRLVPGRLPFFPECRLTVELYAGNIYDEGQRRCGTGVRIIVIGTLGSDHVC